MKPVSIGISLHMKGKPFKTSAMLLGIYLYFFGIKKSYTHFKEAFIKGKYPKMVN
jgi:hypothetical protein